MLPLVLALIALNGMDPTAAFFCIGAAYILVALVYRLPIPVQPLKSVSALALALGLAPAVIVTGTIWKHVAFLGMGLVGLDRWVHNAFPKPVVRGIQLGLAWNLLKSAWALVSKTPDTWDGGFSFSGLAVVWLWVLVGGAIGALLISSSGSATCRSRCSRLWYWHLRVSSGAPATSSAVHPAKDPALVPTWQQLWQGLILIALPQIPLSIGNSVYATADAARQYFEERASRVTERKLMLTMGAADRLTALLGGAFLFATVAGGSPHITAWVHGPAVPFMLGSIFLALGLFGGQASIHIWLDSFPCVGGTAGLCGTATHAARTRPPRWERMDFRALRPRPYHLDRQFGCRIR